MAGSLILIQETTVSSATASVSITGIDSTYDVYMLVVHSYIPSSDNKDMRLRVLESGTPNTTSNYDMGGKVLRTDTSFGNDSHTNATDFDTSTGIGNASNEMAHWIIYMYNAFNSSEYTLFTHEITMLSNDPILIGRQGGGVFKSNSQVNGVQLRANSGNIENGVFKLYGLKK